MSLLEFERVSKRYVRGSRVRIALREISLELDSGELVAIWGLRGSGRSTLLRLAAGIERPDLGAVRLAGYDLASLPRVTGALGDKIGYCHPTLFRRRSPLIGRTGTTVLEELVEIQLARGVAAGAARACALQALERVGALLWSELVLDELDDAEVVRVVLAQALTCDPGLLVIDEPTKGVDLLERDPILSLLRSLADEGIAILMSVGKSTGLFGADRALAMSGGELLGHVTPDQAPVVRLPTRARA